MRTTILLFFLCTILSSCAPNEEEDKDRNSKDGAQVILSEQNELTKVNFPEVIELTDAMMTEFAICMEEEILFEKNCIYAPTLGLAWSQIDSLLKNEPFEFSSLRMKILDGSESYQHTLLPHEYELELDIVGDEIFSKASFSRNLTFSEPFMVKDDGLDFGGKMVEAFHFFGTDHRAELKYYESDENFAIQLFPEENQDEIILMKSSFDDLSTLGGAYERLVSNTIKFNSNEFDDWRRELTDEDYTLIPKIKFNFEFNFPDVVNSFFLTTEQMYVFKKCYQRNAFVLDETGAIVQSEAEIAVESTEEIDEETELPKPKVLVFDKPFIVFVKKKQSDFPYMITYIRNVDLLELKN